MIDLKGHAALVTGSSKGVGKAIAEAYAAAGADVLDPRPRATARGGRDDRARAALRRAARVRRGRPDAAGGRRAAVPTPRSRRCRTLDILVNNAGQFFDVTFEEMTRERFERTMRLNVESAYFLTQSFAKHWIANNVTGRVLFIGSINGRLAEPGSTAYDTSKGAVEMMVQDARRRAGARRTFA